MSPRTKKWAAMITASMVGFVAGNLALKYMNQPNPFGRRHKR